jgi:uncharacterized membrane protein
MNRIREIDVMRTAAMLLMVVYHILFDLNNFARLEICYYKPPLSLIGKLSALIFIFLSGVSSGLSSKPLRRGITVFACGMLVTLVTFVFFKDSFVVFGILHLLGICMILSAPMKKASLWLLALITVLSAAAGWYFNKLTVEAWILLPFGIVYEEFASVDYYPLFPYISVFMAGVIYYRIFYKDKKSIFNLKPKNDIIERLSKRSLIIYLLHQPIILGIIYTVAFIRRQ